MIHRILLIELFTDYCDAKTYLSFELCDESEFPSLTDNFKDILEKIQKLKIKAIKTFSQTGKGGSLEDTLMYKYSFPVALYTFLTPSQFLSHWELAEPLFCSEKLSCLPYKNQNKSLTFSSLVEKFKFAVW